MLFNRISASEWNDSVRHLLTRYPIRAQFKENTPYHTWMIRPEYDEKKKQWAAYFIAGAVNSQIATTQAVYGDMPEATQKYIQQTQPEKIFSNKSIVQVPLDFQPPLYLSFREIGGFAQPISITETGGKVTFTYENIPQYFLKMGVSRPGSDAPPAPESRRLFASDIVLRKPRAYLTNDIQSDPLATGGSVLSVNAVPAAPKDVNDPPRVVSIAKFATGTVETNFTNIFYQRFQDEPFDELHLSTVYALSQPLEAGGSFPAWIDDSFQIMTRYYCHYNLAHATKTLPRAVTPPLTLVTGLAAGLGDVLFNYILANQNDFTQGVLDMFNQRNLRGVFWAI